MLDLCVFFWEKKYRKLKRKFEIINMKQNKNKGYLLEISASVQKIFQIFNIFRMGIASLFYF